MKIAHKTNGKKDEYKYSSNPQNGDFFKALVVPSVFIYGTSGFIRLKIRDIKSSTVSLIFTVNTKGVIHVINALQITSLTCIW